MPGDDGMSGNLASLLAAAAVAKPDGAALVWHDQTVTWQAFDAAADAVAGGLLSRGLGAGDRVAIVLGNVPEFAFAFYGAVRAGLVAVPMNKSLTASERRHVLADSGARAVFGHSGDADGLLALAADLPALEHVVVVGGTVPAGGTAFSGLTADQPVVPAEGGEQLAVVSYTSGTSGRPRGAMLTHRALLANLDQASRIEPPLVEPSDVVLVVLPLFHIYGLNTGLGLAVRHGATAVMAERFEPTDTLHLLEQYQVTLVVGAPPMYVAWSMLPDAERAFASVRLAVSGAAPLPSAVLTRMMEATGHHVFEGYGLTETAPMLTTTLMSEAAKPGSIGKALPGVELRLADPGDLLDEPEGDLPGEVGIIEVRGDNLFSGYWPDGHGGPDADGWWATGDVAFADDDGDLHLVDRVRELILVSGFNVYPREVEEVLDAHPAVQESAVIGIAHPYTGESVKALVVTHAGAQVTGDELIDWAAKRLARFKCPTAVQFVTELPHTATGKVSKGQLRELAGELG